MLKETFRKETEAVRRTLLRRLWWGLLLGVDMEVVVSAEVLVGLDVLVVQELPLPRLGTPI